MAGLEEVTLTVTEIEPESYTDAFFLHSFLFLCLLCGLSGWLFRAKDPATTTANAAVGGNATSPDDQAKPTRETEVSANDNLELLQASDFANFRRNWLTVYYLVMAGDWLQGPYLFKLYSSYGYSNSEIAVLFITGFLSSAVFGTIAGSVADKFGRKKACLLCSTVYSTACFIKNVNVYTVLLGSHLLSGIATSLLFSVYEAWMVAEHNLRGFKPAWLSETFSWATFGNGIVAMLAGMVADQICALVGSYVAPYVVAVLFFVLAGTLVASTWVENYGSRDGTGPNLSSTIKSIKESVGMALKDKGVFAVGGIQAFFETAMYTFVYLWTPSLETTKNDPAEILPYGTIFSSFMVSIMIGSTIFRVLSSQLKWTSKQIARPAFIIATIAMVTPAYFRSRFSIFWSFNVFEMCVGIYFPLGGTLRSRHVPERLRATMMTVFRIPLNVMTVIALLKAPTLAPESNFVVCGFLLAVSFSCSLLLPEDGDGRTASYSNELNIPMSPKSADVGEVGSSPI